MFAIFTSESMGAFYANIFSFPTVLFTFLLVAVAFYWLAAVIGLVDLDLFDIDVPENDMNISDSTSVADTISGLLFKLGLTGVPFTISLSFIAVVGWVTSYYLVYFLPGNLDSGILRWLLGLPILVGSLFISVLITIYLIKPLKPLFAKAMGSSAKSLIGQTATVRSSKVDKHFGEINLQVEGADLMLNVRSIGEDIYTKGDRVVIIEYIKETNVYKVISEQEFLNI